MRRETSFYPFYGGRNVTQTTEYALHKPSGQARVRINGKEIYLGEYDSPESHEEYKRLLARFFLGKLDVDRDSLSISRLAIMYVEFAKGYYRKDGVQTSEISIIQLALKPVVNMFGREKIHTFGPRKLKLVRDEMIQRDLARTTINKAVQRITRILRWASENEYAEGSIYQSCRCVTGLRRGRCEAREPVPVDPEPVADIEAVELFVSRTVWSMIQLQLCTGMRPGEVCIMRACDIDVSGEVWDYIPKSHKTEHHNRQRLVPIGPRGQAILRPYLAITKVSEYLFRPDSAEKVRNELRRAARKCLSLLPAMLLHKTADGVVAALVSMLITKPLEQPHGRMTLLRRGRFIDFQDLPNAIHHQGEFREILGLPPTVFLRSASVDSQFFHGRCQA